jgi:ketosteroid isomerase-like protein
MRRPVVIVILISISLFLFGCRRHENPASVKKAIEAQDKIFEQAFNSMNVSGVMSVYWESPDLVAMYPDGNYRGYDDVKQSWWDLFNKVEVKKFEVTESHIEIDNDVAYEWGMFNFTFQPKGGTVIGGPGRYLEVWKKINNKWVIVADHASLPVPPPTQVPETKEK